MCEKALDSRRSVLGPRHARPNDTMAALGETRNLAGRYAEAEPVLRECLAIQRQTAPDDHRRFRTESLLGQTLLHLNRFSESEPLLLSGYEGLKQREARLTASRRSLIAETARALVALYEAWNRPADSTRWRALLPSTH